VNVDASVSEHSGAGPCVDGRRGHRRGGDQKQNNLRVTVRHELVGDPGWRLTDSHSTRRAVAERREVIGALSRIYAGRVIGGGVVEPEPVSPAITVAGEPFPTLGSTQRRRLLRCVVVLVDLSDPGGAVAAR
jgi:hypothetical protein